MKRLQDVSGLRGRGTLLAKEPEPSGRVLDGLGTQGLVKGVGLVESHRFERGERFMTVLGFICSCLWMPRPVEKENSWAEFYLIPRLGER